MNLALTNEQTEALIRELSQIVQNDRYPLSPRIFALEETMGQLRSEPERGPLPPRRHYELPSKGDIGDEGKGSVATLLMTRKNETISDNARSPAAAALLAHSLLRRAGHQQAWPPDRSRRDLGDAGRAGAACGSAGRSGAALALGWLAQSLAAGGYRSRRDNRAQCVLG